MLEGCSLLKLISDYDGKFFEDSMVGKNIFVFHVDGIQALENILIFREEKNDSKESPSIDDLRELEKIIRKFAKNNIDTSDIIEIVSCKAKANNNGEFDPMYGKIGRLEFGYYYSLKEKCFVTNC